MAEAIGTASISTLMYFARTSLFSVEEYLHLPEPSVFYINRMKAQRELAESCAQYCSFSYFETPTVETVASSQTCAEESKKIVINPFQEVPKGPGPSFLEKRIPMLEQLKNA
jgi:hypothetical protein